MRPLMEILEDERALMLKMDTIYQNMIRYDGVDAQSILLARKRIVDRDLEFIRNELREYIMELIDHGE